MLHCHRMMNRLMVMIFAMMKCMRNWMMILRNSSVVTVPFVEVSRMFSMNRNVVLNTLPITIVTVLCRDMRMFVVFL